MTRSAAASTAQRRSTRPQLVRLEPVAHLFERGLVHPAADGLERLEDELALFVPGERLDSSPDPQRRGDLGLTDLLVRNTTFRVRSPYRRALDGG